MLFPDAAATWAGSWWVQALWFGLKGRADENVLEQEGDLSSAASAFLGLFLSASGALEKSFAPGGQIEASNPVAPHLS